MDARIQALPFDPALLRGLSEKLLTSHHQNNYVGAVKRLNAIRAQLAPLGFATAPGFQLNGLKCEELIATNSMLLHELYFGCLGGDGATMEPPMALALAANFGSVERWREEFVALGKAQGGGSGWVLLMFQPREGSLVNQWAAITRTRWLAVCRSWHWTCTSTPTTWISVRRPVPMSMPSWTTSTGRMSIRVTREPCTAPAKLSAQRMT